MAYLQKVSNLIGSKCGLRDSVLIYNLEEFCKNNINMPGKGKARRGKQVEKQSQDQLKLDYYSQLVELPDI